MKAIPFWPDNHPKPALPLSSEFPSETDVAIIDSGYTGLSCARTLSKADISVDIFERVTIGCTRDTHKSYSDSRDRELSSFWRLYSRYCGTLSQLSFDL